MMQKSCCQFDDSICGDGGERYSCGIFMGKCKVIMWRRLLFCIAVIQKIRKVQRNAITIFVSSFGLCKLIYAALLTGLLGVALPCLAGEAIQASGRPANWGVLIDKEHNLYQISPYLYRSEQPTASQTHQLQQLGIDTIVSLRTRNKTHQEFIHGPFDVINIPIHTWSIDRQDVLDTMRHLKELERNQRKTLIHCYHGSDRTGTMVAMYRVFFQDWDPREAVKEMKEGGYGFHSIWVNIDDLFLAENIEWIRENLNK